MCSIDKKDSDCDHLVLVSPMVHKLLDMLLFIAFCLLHVYVVITYWKWLLVLIVLYIGHRLTKGRFKLTTAGKAVLITGCDTGFGHHIAKRLDDMGFTVYAGVLNEISDGAEVLRSRKSHNLHVIKLDVTEEEDVHKSLKYVTSNNKADLWAVVNNAGINMSGDVELATVEQYKKCAEVNLYGPIRVIRAFLPLIRRSKGRIVNVSSVMGRYSVPNQSMYLVTKHGMETLSDSLRLEMKKFGVKVALIEPGGFGSSTSLIGPETMKRFEGEADYMWDHASEEVKKTYGRQYFYRNVVTTMTKQEPVSISPVTEAVEDAIVAENPNTRYIVSACFLDKFTVFARVYCFLPSWITDIIADRLYRYSSGTIRRE